jgi:hypothetical protein
MRRSDEEIAVDSAKHLLLRDARELGKRWLPGMGVSALSREIAAIVADVEALERAERAWHDAIQQMEKDEGDDIPF